MTTGTAVAVRGRARPARASAPPRPDAWERRIYDGLCMRGIGDEVRGALLRALSEIGVEAEFYLRLLAQFPARPEPSRADGEIFITALHATGLRLVRASNAVEVTSQAFAAELERVFPSARGGADAEGWWPPFSGYAPSAMPIELRLRRCGFAYRHVLALRLAEHIDAVAEQLAFVLHALSTLPPAGVLPVESLHQGLIDLAAQLQGDLVPHHLLDLSPTAPGLLGGLTQLRTLTASEDTSYESDVAWIHAQYSQVRAATGGALSETQRRWAESSMEAWRSAAAALTRLHR